MRVVHVCRKPCSEGTVAKNTLKHGCGALNIDATRILSGAQPSATKAPGWDSYNKTNAEEGYRPADYAQGDAMYIPSTEGRWPANLVLQHLPGCLCQGVKQVKPSNGSGVAGAGSPGFQSVYVGGVKKAEGFGGSHVSADGKETVADWVCEPGCPVAELDEQSGVSNSAVRQGGEGIHLDPTRESWRFKRAQGGFTDSGGASRFFKQVGGDKT